MQPATRTPDDPLARVHHALQPVLDPELGLSIVDLGLIGEVRRDADTLVVELLTTTPACPMRETLHEGVREALERAFAGDTVEVRVSPLAWAPARMSPGARRALGWE